MLRGLFDDPHLRQGRTGAVLNSLNMEIHSQRTVVERIRRHLLGVWPECQLRFLRWHKGPVGELGLNFTVCEASPTKASNNLWVYCTAGTGPTSNESQSLEFVLFAPSGDERHVETLTMLAHFHRFESKLDVGHRVKIGRPWIEGSACDGFLISLPYPIGPQLEWLRDPDFAVRFLWALPITPREAAFAAKNGVERLEQQFDVVKLRYWDPLRQDAV